MNNRNRQTTFSKTVYVKFKIGSCPKKRTNNLLSLNNCKVEMKKIQRELQSIWIDLFEIHIAKTNSNGIQINSKFSGFVRRIGQSGSHTTIAMCACVLECVPFVFSSTQNIVRASMLEKWRMRFYTHTRTHSNALQWLATNTACSLAVRSLCVLVCRRFFVQFVHRCFLLTHSFNVCTFVLIRHTHTNSIFQIYYKFFFIFFSFYLQNKNRPKRK